ncbi:DNA-binding response regulator, NarL/FixJ family, contains REC and HTH domains [Friedmanniella luteola]|uniref:DNA-binding response regulator, NarL/FixJ family, contains REC and HTH domains n=1 Tax=Friedmanniella luteola TaxID=546871 RepID=A0A1H1WQT1_9ACTN|nr:response regulator transcription factor [Friedmanniella luteola]SDS99493.1 DNA-binding response regulator, NarL/FixJ family, contains REC and HTH domains [Friedmanniella luteola]
MLSNNDDRTPQNAAPTTGPTAPVRVLIVDDNAPFSSLLSAALDAVDGMECVGTARSASEGFQRVVELAPTVVVMDIMMPGLDGLAATTELRRLSPETAVAVVSAHSDPEWIARAEDAGASAYIPKSGSLSEMVAVLSAARPGPMAVASSLQAAWSSSRVTDPTRADRQPASPLQSGDQQVARDVRSTKAAIVQPGRRRDILRLLRRG